MDGTRDQPPGKNAENWSRRDGIRAGAVSGPWRSAPRGQTPAAAPLAAPPAHAPLPGDAIPPQARATPTNPAARPAAPAATRTVTSAPRPRPTVPARRRTQAMIAGIAGGLIGAVGLVVAAFLFRPDSAAEPAPAATEPAPQVAAPTPAPPTGEPSDPAVSEVSPPPARPDSLVPLANPALATVTSVRLRVGPDFPPDRQQTIVAALQAAGLPAVEVETLPFAIATSRVGYYRPEDLPAAEALSQIVNPLAPGAGDAAAPIGVRDYARLLEDAAPGRLDLWIGD